MFVGGGSNLVNPNDVLPVIAGISRLCPDAFAADAGVTVPSQDFGPGEHDDGVIPTLSVVTFTVLRPVIIRGPFSFPFWAAV